MSPQTETKASVGFQVGVKDYRLTYYTPEYETKDTDILAALWVIPQPEDPLEEAGAVVAAESSTGTWQLFGLMDLPILIVTKGDAITSDSLLGRKINGKIGYRTLDWHHLLMDT